MTGATQEDVWARKKASRQAIKAALKEMSKKVMASESKAICEHVAQLGAFSKARTLGIYVHCERLREVDTSSILQHALQAGKRCYVPLVQDKASNMQLLHLDDMSALTAVPPFGILEPSTTYADGQQREDALDAQGGKPLDLLLMPGLGFDARGNRLGRGGGYYDKAVARLRIVAEEQGRAPPLLMALAFSAQVVPSIPVLPHDQQVDVLVTAQGLHPCTAAGQQAVQHWVQGH